MSTTVLFAGGGTAGHVFPAVAVAQALAGLGDYEPVFVGTEGRLESRLVPEAGFDLETIDALPLPRTLSTGLVRLPFGLRRSIKQVTNVIRQRSPVAAVAFGGYVSFPLSRAAWRNDVPLLLHEQNAVPGLANQVAARWAESVALTFPSSAPHFAASRRTVVTGNPVRQEILDMDRVALHARARERFELEVDRPTVLAFGGSQGARSLNRAVAGAADHWAEAGVQVIHAAGTKLHEETVAMWQDAVGGDPAAGPTVRILDFIDDMALAYAAADFVVCRAGATSMAELTALGLPAVLVPYPAATRDHQMHNANALATIGGAKVVADHELRPATLVAAVSEWLADPSSLAQASERARAFGRRDAATLVAAAIHEMIAPAPTAPGLVTGRDRPGKAELPGIDDEAFEAAFNATSEAGERVESDMLAAIVANEREAAQARRLEGTVDQVPEQVPDQGSDQGSATDDPEPEAAAARDWLDEHDVANGDAGGVEQDAVEHDGAPSESP